MIRNENNQYCVYSSDGSRSFGCYDTEESAKKRLSEIEYFKRDGKEDTDKPLNKPFRLPKGSSKKFGVYVKDGDSIKKVTFGDPNMEIRRDDPDARASFRARHNCDTATDKTSARYWSCRMWESDSTVSDETKESHRFCANGILSVKEELDIIVVKGYIATTHPDQVQDIILKETLDMWCDGINEGNPRMNKVTYHHDRNDVRVVGRGKEGTARVDQLPDGEYGLYVETIINSTHPNFDIIKQEIDLGMIDSFSIEYATPADLTHSDDGYRYLDTSSQLYGWTLASRPVNEKAVMIKELLRSQRPSFKESGDEVQTMSDNTNDSKMTEAQLKELQELKEYKKQMDEEQKKKDEQKKMEEEKKKKEQEMASMKEALFQEILQSKELGAKLDSIAQKPQMSENKEHADVKPEFRELQNVLQSKEYTPSIKLANAVTYAIKEGLLENGTPKVESRLDTKGFDHVESTGFSLQVKSTGLSSNLAGASSATALAAHRSADLVEALDAGLFNLLNDTVSLYDFLPKTSAAGSGSDHASFVVRAGRNPSAGAYTGNEITTGRSNRYKFSTKFKKYKAGFAVDGDLIAANRGAPQGSALAAEIESATLDMKKDLNTDLYTEQGLESSAKVIGMKYIADSAGNTSLYGETRSSANGLAPATAGDTYIDGSTGSIKSLLRTAIKNIKVDGGNAREIFIAMHDTQMARLKGEEDNALRYQQGDSNIGFADKLTFEGYRIIEDVDCPEGSIFVFDRSTVELRFWVTPTVEMLGKRSDSEEGFVKTYVASVYKAPRRVVEIHSVPTA